MFFFLPFCFTGYVGTGKRGALEAIYSEAEDPGYCNHFIGILQSLYRFCKSLKPMPFSIVNEATTMDMSVTN